MANRYWVGGAGTWDTTTTTNWSDTSGGVGGASVPTAADAVFLDANSGTGALSLVSGPAQLYCASFDSTGSSITTFNQPAGNQTTINCSGNWTSAATLAYVRSPIINFVGNATITTNGCTTFPDISVNGAGITVTMADDLVVGNTCALGLTLGTFEANNKNLCFEGGVSITGTGVRTLNMGSGQWRVGYVFTNNATATIWNASNTTNLTFNKGTANILCVQNYSIGGSSPTAIGIRTFAGGGLTYNGITFGNSSALGAPCSFVITGANTFSSMSFSQFDGTYIYVVFPNGSTTTITSFSNYSGSLSKFLSLRTQLSGTKTTISTSGTATLDYIVIKDLNLTGSGTVTATNSYLSNNTTGFVFGSGTSYYEILDTVGDGTWSIPSTWTPDNNKIHIIGAGGGGGSSVASGTNRASGGGGGAGGYTKLINKTYASAINYSIGAGGGGDQDGATTGWDGTPATLTYSTLAFSQLTTVATSMTATLPSVSAGNLMILGINLSNTNANVSTPAGWTAGVGNNLNGRAVFYKYASSSEPASLGLSFSRSATADVLVLIYENAQWDTNTADSAATATPTPSPMTISANNSTVIWYGFDSAASRAYATPTGYTLLQDDSDATNPSLAVFHLQNVSAGSYTAPASSVNAGANTGRVFTIAIKPTLTAFNAYATGGTAGYAFITPLSTGGVGGTGYLGVANYSGGSGGVGGTSTLTNYGSAGGGGGGAAGPYGNGGNGGNGFAANSTNGMNGGGGGGNGGGSNGGNATISVPGNGGNNYLGTGGSTTSTAGTLGGGGRGGRADAAGMAGGSGVDIMPGYGSGGGAGGTSGGGNTAPAAGSYGAGGSGAGIDTGGQVGSGGAGSQGAIIILWNGPLDSTGSFLMLFL